jgi:hypothetical protein
LGQNGNCKRIFIETGVQVENQTSSNKGMSQQDHAVNIWMGDRRVNRIL